MNSVNHVNSFSLFREPITLTISPFLQKIGAIALAIFALYAIYSYFFNESVDQKNFDVINRKLDNLDGRLIGLANNVNAVQRGVIEIHDAFFNIGEESEEKNEFRRA